MLHIKSIIPKILKREGIQKQIESAEVCKIADRVLKTALGDNDTKAVFFRNGNIQIRCPNSVIANEIQLRKERIKNEINDDFGRELIKNILVKTG